jgi:twitching motility protein PilT
MAQIISILDDAIERKASDIHLVVGKPPIFRIDGRLVVRKAKPILKKELESMLTEILTSKQWATFLAKHELDFAFEEESHRFRMNLHVERGNPALAARVIRMQLPTFEEIGIPDVVRDMTKLPNGLILVTGPAGTGKSTTLAAMLGEINATRPAHIVTLEDPIEFVYPSGLGLVKQREVGTDTESFAEGLKHMLRQDPDVVMVGEMRDPETIATTLTLAETGHLVFSTLHTRSAPATINRIIDSFPPNQQNQVRLQLALSLRGIISQVLLPRAKGGRVAAREVLVANPAIANLIRENKVEQIGNVVLTGRKAGMVSLEQSIQDLIKQGVVTDTVAMQFTETKRH